MKWNVVESVSFGFQIQQNRQHLVEHVIGIHQLVRDFRIYGIVGGVENSNQEIRNEKTKMD